MTYEQQILKILTEAGEKGISVQAISKHVYNINRTFFFQPNYEEIKTYVQQYLLKNSKSSFSLIESTGRRGFYRLNTTGSADAMQMYLQFRDEHADKEEPVLPPKDLSLDLFG